MKAALGRAAAIGLLLAAGAARADPLQSALDEWPGSTQHRGVSAAVVFADGRVWEGVAGRAQDGEPVRAEHLMAIINAKLKGKKIVVEEPEEPEATNVLDLMTRLQESLSQGKKKKGKKAAAADDEAEAPAAKEKEKEKPKKKRKTA